MNELEKSLDELQAAKTIENAFVRVGKGDEILYETRRGEVDEHTLFDMASVTKIMATTPLALIAIDRGLLSLDDEVKEFFPSEPNGRTIEHLLTHTIGIGHKSLNKEGYTYENIAEKILKIPLDRPVGKETLYSCPAFILLGKILEKIYGQRLDEVFLEWVAKPLGLENTSFLPKRKELAVNANLSADERGVVNDYNCRFLGGATGNAGLFSDVEDVTKYARWLLQKGAPLIGEKTFYAASKNYTADKSESRGLGFLYVDERYAQTGGLFADGAIGHCGHTGQSVFADYRSGLFAIILSDATISTVKKYGHERYDEVIDARANLHEAILKDLKNKEKEI